MAHWDIKRIEELESTVARLHMEAYSARRGHTYWYERCRLLENAIRDAATLGADPERELIKLARRVPLKPRKKWSIGRASLRGRRR